MAYNQLAQSYKKKYNLKIGVVNFDPMPKMFFNKRPKTKQNCSKFFRKDGHG